MFLILSNQDPVNLEANENFSCLSHPSSQPRSIRSEKRRGEALESVIESVGQPARQLGATQLSARGEKQALINWNCSI